MRIPALLAHSLLLTTLAAAPLAAEPTPPAGSPPPGSASAKDSEAEALQHLSSADTSCEKWDFRAAVDHCRAGLKLVTRERSPKTWALLQTNLASAAPKLANALGGQEGKDLREDAVQACRAALEVYTKETFPEDWARTQCAMAFILRNQHIGQQAEESAQLLRQCVEAYRAALQVYTRETAPKEWAEAQHQLAMALKTQSGMETDQEVSKRRRRESAEAYRAALTVFTRDAQPADWAESQNSLANYLLVEGSNHRDPLEGVGLLVESVQCYRAATEVYTRQDMPEAWAATRNLIGLALGQQDHLLGGGADPKLLEEALQMFRSVLEVYTPERQQHQWASVQQDLGDTLEILGDRQFGPEQRARWEEAEKAYLAAVNYYKPPGTAPSMYEDRLNGVSKKLNR